MSSQHRICQFQKNKHTLQNIKLSVTRFNDWLGKRGEKRPIEELEVEMLDQLLALFLTDICKPQGEEYEPCTLQSFSNCIRHHISEIKVGVEDS